MSPLVFILDSCAVAACTLLKIHYCTVFVLDGPLREGQLLLWGCDMGTAGLRCSREGWKAALRRHHTCLPFTKALLSVSSSLVYRKCSESVQWTLLISTFAESLFFILFNPLNFHQRIYNLNTGVLYNCCHAACATVRARFVPSVPQILLTCCFSLGVAHQCYHGFIKAVQEGNIQWESRTYPYPGTPITQRFSHSK